LPAQERLKRLLVRGKSGTIVSDRRRVGRATRDLHIDRHDVTDGAFGAGVAS